ncbi:MAG TPA: hypothetical protein VIO62_05700 [Candidatus Dormibacteraeota bacterium]|jgi:hypothetical protein
MDLDALCRQARDHHLELLAEAARERLRSRPRPTRPAATSFRRLLAIALRRWADRLEPSMATSTGPLRALAHREIDVDQAMLLLDYDDRRLRVAANR